MQRKHLTVQRNKRCTCRHGQSLTEPITITLVEFLSTHVRRRACGWLVTMGDLLLVLGRHIQVAKCPQHPRLELPLLGKDLWT